MIKIFRESVFSEKTHQNGWNVVLKLMRTHLHQQAGAPAFLDDFVDISFGDNIGDKGIPYRHPWVGMIHHPVDIPVADPVLALKAARVMMNTWQFKESLKQCKGLITFSPSNAREVRKVLAEIGAIVPVFTLTHPTCLAAPEFLMEKFVKRRQINCVGFWLRRLHTFAELRTDLTKRYIFMSHNAAQREAQLKKCCDGIPKGCIVMPYLDYDTYSFTLQSGIGFADYYACVASNTILEHIAQSTPILVNKLPSIVDYLGQDYPFYFSDLREAEDKLRKPELIKETHEYLHVRAQQPMFRYEYFIEALRGVLKKCL